VKYISLPSCQLETPFIRRSVALRLHTHAHTLTRTHIRVRVRGKSTYLPGQYDKQVKPIPAVAKVRLASTEDESHGDHLDAHFDGEECEDAVVEPFEDAAPGR
jgi:hypothetical protein